MADHITEEEQVEALKRWWKENGTSLLIGVLLAVGGYFGWQFWQAQQQQSREAASALFNDMMETGIADPGQTLTEQDIAKVTSIADELMTSYSKTLYANDAAMLLAKIAVDNNDLNTAEQHLRWILDNSPSDNVKALATLRLAVVLYSEDKLDEALELVSTAPDDSFSSRYAEVRGDILLAQGNTADARTAYQTAVDNLLQSQSSRRDIIQMKITDIDAEINPNQTTDEVSALSAPTQSELPADAEAVSAESDNESARADNDNAAANPGTGQSE